MVWVGEAYEDLIDFCKFRDSEKIMVDVLVDKCMNKGEECLRFLFKYKPLDPDGEPTLVFERRKISRFLQSSDVGYLSERVKEEVDEEIGDLKVIAGCEVEKGEVLESFK